MPCRKLLCRNECVYRRWDLETVLIRVRCLPPYKSRPRKSGKSASVRRQYLPDWRYDSFPSLPMLVAVEAVHDISLLYYLCESVNFLPSLFYLIWFRILGSFILSSSAKKMIFVSISAVFGSSSTKGRNSRPRLCECTGRTAICAPPALWITPLPK